MYIFLKYIINVCGLLRNRSQFSVFVVIFVLSALKLTRSSYYYLRSITSVKMCYPVVIKDHTDVNSSSCHKFNSHLVVKIRFLHWQSVIHSHFHFLIIGSATSEVFDQCYKNQFLHSFWVHICPWWARHTSVIITMDVHLTIFNHCTIFSLAVLSSHHHHTHVTWQWISTEGKQRITHKNKPHYRLLCWN